MDRIKMFRMRLAELSAQLKHYTCPRIRAEIRLEMAECRLTIAAIRYGHAFGYQNDRKGPRKTRGKVAGPFPVRGMVKPAKTTPRAGKGAR